MYRGTTWQACGAGKGMPALAMRRKGICWSGKFSLTGKNCFIQNNKQ